ncbi:hypothetical protein [Flavobacterium sp. HSC-61S13]|uniref:hypothetical protein n=1 Tax=Flavobacterium sp. HSC-61S13 TaxID=2910963 RepID=UPI0020A033B7|nr:hypothetical protein [Flavobacterium sp. HSC-61S13]MCP1995887.1 hypothetical protein [Flavobacterium sp. HSC-61S13]
MKKIFLLLFAVVGLVGLQSCEGPEGPPGFDGAPGPIFEAEVFEVTTDFLRSNNYESVFTFSKPILKTDHLLVYHLDQVVNGEDVWKMTPATYYIGSENLIYNFDFTRLDFKLFLDTNIANIDRVDGGAWTNKQTFRVVIIPGYMPKRSLDTSSTAVENTDYNTIIKKYNLENAPIKQLQAK